MPSVNLRNLKKRFGTISVLKGISLEITDGEFLTLLGPSGCGKSTLLRVVAGLETHDRGSVSINGRVVDAVRPKRRDVAMVFQSYALYPHMTVAANIALPLVMRRLSGWQRLPFVGWLFPGTGRLRKDIQGEVRELATAIGIDSLLRRKPSQLSGGQRQRVALARAMVRRPAVFLMDEPLSSLDSMLRVTMRAEIKELHKKLGATFIYVTHDQAEAMTLSDRVAVMLEGELLQVAPPSEIYSDPDDLRVAEFIGSPTINLLEAVVSEGGLANVAGSMLSVGAVGIGKQITIGIRPEAFHITERSGIGILMGSVRLVEHMGSDLFVHLEMPGITKRIVARLASERAPSIHLDQVLHLEVKPSRMLLFAKDGKRIRPEASVTPLRNYAL